MAEIDDPQGGGADSHLAPGAECSTGAGGAPGVPASGDVAAGGPMQAGGKKLSAKQIGDDWRTSRAYAAQRIKAGCPADSLEAAREWRQKNSRYGVGYRSKGKAAASETQTQSVGGSDVPDSKSGAKQIGKIAAPKVGIDPGAEDDERLPEVPGVETLKRSLEGSVKMEWLAYLSAIWLPSEARIRAYNQARDGRFAAEKAYREELERRRVLVPLAEAMVLSRKGYDVLKPALLAMGARIGGNCNPTNAATAAAEIDREVAAILRQAETSYTVADAAPASVPAPSVASPKVEEGTLT